MSDKESELKAGHPKAVKAGGMRITQHKSKHDKDVSLDGYNEESGLLKVSTSPPKTTTISGAVVHGHADYTMEAVQSIHEKPKPSVEKPRANVKPIIHQPRK